MDGLDKALMPFGEGRLIDHVHERLSRQVQTVALNTNNEPIHFAGLGLPVIADDVEGFAGPLAGILAAMEWATQKAAPFSHIVTVATDTPFFPADLVETLRHSISETPGRIAVASSGGRIHPIFGIWPVGLRQHLRYWLNDEGNRRVLSWIESHPHKITEFPTAVTSTGMVLDPFFNINTPEDIAEARKRWTT
jgi:molybdopterin-guanine dinucleotide biosynthesis protein A